MFWPPSEYFGQVILVVTAQFTVSWSTAIQVRLTIRVVGIPRRHETGPRAAHVHAQEPILNWRAGTEVCSSRVVRYPELSATYARMKVSRAEDARGFGTHPSFWVLKA